MPRRTPSAVAALCRRNLPTMLARADGQRILADVATMVSTDRWNSFDRFHDTTAALVKGFRGAGAAAEVEPIQTGGALGSGRWIIQEAADINAATVDVVEPLQQRLLDYRESPWHAIQWTAGTPREGLHCELAIVDDRAELECKRPGELAGKAVLSRGDVRSLLPLLADKGAAAVIYESNVPVHPDALNWTKFGWGAIPMRHATARLVGYVLTHTQGQELRALAAQHGRLELHLKADVRKYVGTHDVVSGVIQGSADSGEEIWSIAHSAEPGAIDNASGISVSVEIARILQGLIDAGELPPPRHTIRLLCAYECYGFFAYLERRMNPRTPLAGVCIDSVGAAPEVCGKRVEWHSTIPMSASFVDDLGAAILRAAVLRNKPGYTVCRERFVSTSDTLIGDPQYGYPCPWLTTHHKGPGRGFDAYHSSADTIDLLSAAGLETCAAAMAGYLYQLASMGAGQAAQLLTAESAKAQERLASGALSVAECAYVQHGFEQNVARLSRWAAADDTADFQEVIGRERQAVDEQTERAQDRAAKAQRTTRKRIPSAARRIPHRTAPLSPTMENTPTPIADRIDAAGMRPWALFWADGERSIADIAAMISCEGSDEVNQVAQLGRGEVDLKKLIDYFEAHAELGYCELLEPRRTRRSARKRSTRR